MGASGEGRRGRHSEAVLGVAVGSLGRITVGLTRSKSLTIIVSPRDMIGMIGMAQVLATLAYGISGLRSISTWDWPSFHRDPQIENNSQMDRWSLNRTPVQDCPPLAIANRYLDRNSQRPKCIRYRLILVHSSNFDWLLRDNHAMKQLRAAVQDGQNSWVPQQNVPFDEIILFAYAADRTPRPTYVCLPTGLVHARSGRAVERIGPQQEVTPLPGISFFDVWRVEPVWEIPTDLPNAQNGPEESNLPSPCIPQN